VSQAAPMAPAVEPSDQTSSLQRETPAPAVPAPASPTKVSQAQIPPAPFVQAQAKSE
jgi:flagella basal body P-ring formation protein FlgA